ncbi:sensor histidine kinase [Pseudoduganella sp. UC29_106]|uniref:sensor histidine kinase n=1 Tax=Pseudoduganella sp. UC29_106 TaxID=3374553 RepID=UPI0037569B7E
MQGALTSRGAALYLLVWLLLGAGLGGVVAVMAPGPWVYAMVLMIPATLVFSVGAGFSAYYLCRSNPLGERSPAAILLSLSTAAVLAGFMWVGILQGWNAVGSVFGTAVTVSPSLTALLFALGVLLYGLLVAVNYLVAEASRARNAERRELESKLMARDAELRMLRTQIDPHFLFNSLNSISALTSMDPKGAREMTLRLSDFFRQSLGMDAHRKVTLEQEMALNRHFLAIEKVRFGERLVHEEAIEKGARDCLVPPMIVQPLVENAVKHGIGQLPEGGLVLVAAWRSGSRLKITVSNAMDEGAPARRGNGLGLRNVRERLSCAYGHEASVEWKKEDGRFIVEITMPAETNED